MLPETTVAGGIIADALKHVRLLLAATGCDTIDVYIDGPELVIEGCAPSFQAKLILEEQARALMNMPVRNCLRVSPS